jgi:hypothetical protein
LCRSARIDPRSAFEHILEIKRTVPRSENAHGVQQSEALVDMLDCRELTRLLDAPGNEGLWGASGRARPIAGLGRVMHRAGGTVRRSSIKRLSASVPLAIAAAVLVISYARAR